jgi:hypothetical protein
MSLFGTKYQSKKHFSGSSLNMDEKVESPKIREKNREFKMSDGGIQSRELSNIDLQ